MQAMVTVQEAIALKHDSVFLKGDGGYVVLMSETNPFNKLCKNFIVYMSTDGKNYQRFVGICPPDGKFQVFDPYTKTTVDIERHSDSVVIDEAEFLQPASRPTHISVENLPPSGMEVVHLMEADEQFYCVTRYEEPVGSQDTKSWMFFTGPILRMRGVPILKAEIKTDGGTTTVVTAEGMLHIPTPYRVNAVKVWNDQPVRTFYQSAYEPPVILTDGCIGLLQKTGHDVLFGQTNYEKK